MRKRGFSAEILCLFFIISVTILFGKILNDVKSIVGVKLNELIPQPTIVVGYNAYSYKIEKTYDNFEELNIIRNIDDLKKFKNGLSHKKISIDWLDEKLSVYDEDSFDEKTIVILAINNGNNVTVTRINGVSKKNNDLTIGVSKHYKNQKITSEYTWLAVLEISDVNSRILLNSN